MAAYPVEAQVVMPFSSNLPGDVAVNTFHFRADTGDTPTAVGNSIRSLLTNFYNATHVSQTLDIANYLGTVISRSANAIGLKLYDLTDTQPRLPFYNSPFTLDSPGVTTSLPNEVALCMSYRSTYLSGVPQASCRGRVYLGPLTTSTSQSGANLPATVLTLFAGNVRWAGSKLQADSQASITPWVVWSRKLQRMDDVVAGWVDNEFDTQRRRGEDATTRQVW